MLKALKLLDTKLKGPLTIKSTPTEKHLARMYYELAKRGANCVGKNVLWPYDTKTDEELLILAAEMSRYDPRLFTIFVRFILEHWQKLNPVEIRRLYATMSTPQVFAVATEFLLKSDLLNQEGQFFCEYLQKGLKPAALQLFFHNLYRVGGNMMQLAVEEALWEYKKWGFIAREAPIVDEKSRRMLGTLDAATRKNILNRLLKNSGEIKLSDYMRKLGYKISRQQALIDIRSVKGMRRSGKGRGASWKLVA